MSETVNLEQKLQNKFGEGIHFCVFPVEPQSPNGKTLICTKSGVSTDSRKSARKWGKPLFLHTFFSQKVRVFRTLWYYFWNRRKPHFLCRLMFLPFGLWGSTGNTQEWFTIISARLALLPFLLAGALVNPSCGQWQKTVFNLQVIRHQKDHLRSNPLKGEPPGPKNSSPNPQAKTTQINKGLTRFHGAKRGKWRHENAESAPD